jgi:hypothetical protein
VSRTGRQFAIRLNALLSGSDFASAKLSTHCHGSVNVLDIKNDLWHNVLSPEINWNREAEAAGSLIERQVPAGGG